MTSDATTAPPTWIWADQVSSWRFWGLLIFYLSTVSLVNAALDLEAPVFIQAAGSSTEQYGHMILARQIAAGAGFSLAWIAIKWRPHVTLVILSLLEIGGLALIQRFLDSAPLWAILFPPAAGFMIQSDLNALMSDRTEPMPA